jgi:hypothetical protein
VDWGKDLIVEDSVPSARIGLDATGKCGFPRRGGSFPEEISRGESVTEMVDKRWKEFGL